MEAVDNNYSMRLWEAMEETLGKGEEKGNVIGKREKGFLCMIYGTTHLLL